MNLGKVNDIYTVENVRDVYDSAKEYFNTAVVPHTQWLKDDRPFHADGCKNALDRLLSETILTQCRSLADRFRQGGFNDKALEIESILCEIEQFKKMYQKFFNEELRLEVRKNMFFYPRTKSDILRLTKLEGIHLDQKLPLSYVATHGKYALDLLKTAVIMYNRKHYVASTYACHGYIEALFVTYLATHRSNWSARTLTDLIALCEESLGESFVLDDIERLIKLDNYTAEHELRINKQDMPEDEANSLMVWLIEFRGNYESRLAVGLAHDYGLDFNLNNIGNHDKCSYKDSSDDILYTLRSMLNISWDDSVSQGLEGLLEATVDDIEITIEHAEKGDISEAHFIKERIDTISEDKLLRVITSLADSYRREGKADEEAWLREYLNKALTVKNKYTTFLDKNFGSIFSTSQDKHQGLTGSRVFTKSAGVS